MAADAAWKRLVPTASSPRVLAEVLRGDRVGRDRSCGATRDVARAADQADGEAGGEAAGEVRGTAIAWPTTTAVKYSRTVVSPLRIRAFTPEQDALLAKGWPELRILTDEPVTPKKASSEALKALWAVDPYFGVEIPRAIARLYLRGYADWPAFIERKGKDDGPVDRALLDAVMEKRMPPSKTKKEGGETYAFRLAEVVYLFEAFLGTEVVVSALAGHMGGALTNLSWWEPKNIDNQAIEVSRLAQILGWLRLRMDAARFDEIVRPLTEPQAKLPFYSSLLGLLADPTSPLSAARTDIPGWASKAFATQRRDAAWLETFARDNKTRFPEATQVIAVVGADVLFRGDTAKLAQLPKWEQLQVIRELGTLREPGAARTIAGLLTSRSTASEAKEWVLEHRDWLEEEALAVLDEKDPAAAAAIRATLEGKEAPPPKSKKELERELRTLLAGVEAKLVAAHGNAAAERAILDETFRGYCQIRAAQGEMMPEAFFTHLLGDRKWKADRATLERWMNVAVEAANAGFA